MTKALIALATLASACASAPATPERAVTDSDYQLQISDDRAGGRFVLDLASKSRRALCVDLESWPNGKGELSWSSQTVFAEADGQRYPIKEVNFGYCPGGCGTYRVGPGAHLFGFVAHDQFDPTAFATEAPTLKFDPPVYFCTGREKLIQAVTQ